MKVKFVSNGGGESITTEKGTVSVWSGHADGKPAVVITIESKDKEEKHEMIVSEKGAYALLFLLGNQLNKLEEAKKS